MADSAFAGKFISKLEKIDREQIETYLKHVLHERGFFDRIFQTLSEGIIVTDMESRIVMINAAAYKLLGISRKQRLLGEALIHFISDSNLVQEISKYNIQSNGDIRTVDVRVQYPRPALYLIKIIPLLDDETKEPASIVLIISDISETRQREMERYRQQRIESLATLTAGIAHEIKNPLNALSIHAQLVQRSLNAADAIPQNPQELERIRQSTEIILEEIRRLNRIVNQFITSVRPFKLQLKYCDINTLIEEIVETIRPDTEKQRIIISLALEQEIDPIIIDEYLMRQALLNIIINAMESVKPGHGKIEIKTLASEQSLFISIKDNGKGMNEEELHRMFEPYFTTKEYGTGLGLFIVYRVVQEHHGEINIQSEPGKGTTFTIQLPLLKRPLRYLPERTEEES